MKISIKLMFFALFTLALNGCATTAPRSSYQTLGKAANVYATNLSSLVDIAAEAEIERSSLTLVDKNLSYTSDERAQANFRAKQITDYDRITAGSAAYLSELSKIKQHLYLFREYFNLMAEYAGSTEGTKTAESIISTATAINSLSNNINGSDAFALSSDVGNRLTAASEYVFALKQKKTLSDRIKLDYEFISNSLLVHEKVIDAVGESLIDDLSTAGNSDTLINLVNPLSLPSSPFSNQAYLERWKSKRREILLTQLSTESLAEASKSAKKFSIALEAVAKKSPNKLVLIDSFISELEHLKSTIDAIR